MLQLLCKINIRRINMRYLYNIFSDLDLECVIIDKSRIKVFNDGIFIITRLKANKYECLYLLPTEKNMGNAEIFYFTNQDSVVDFVTYI